VFICDECVELCMDIIREENKSSLRESPSDRVPTPQEIIGRPRRLCDRPAQAKRVLSVAVHNHYKRLNHASKNNDVELAKSNILLIGPTGCGKTLLAQTLARIIDVPFTMADATTLTEAGYVGEDVENIILKLLQSADYNVERAQRGIVYIDEVDKISPQVRQPVDHPRRVGRGRAAGAAEDHGRHGGLRSAAGRPQASAAGIPAGRHDQHPVHLRWRLRRPRQDHLGRGEKTSIGFGAMFAPDERQVGEMLREVEPEDLLKFGLIPEFVGRLPVLATLEDLDEDALIQILTEPKNALVKQYQRLFEMEEVKLTFHEDALARHRQGHRAQDRRARPALDHGRRSCSTPCSNCRPGRRARSRHFRRSRLRAMPARSTSMPNPVLPLRDIVVFPHMIVPLFVGREKSIAALEEVMRRTSRSCWPPRRTPATTIRTPSRSTTSAPWPTCCSCSSCPTAPSRCWSKAWSAPRSSNTPTATILRGRAVDLPRRRRTRSRSRRWPARW
jgi:ATP-dependent Clp protease ATP-binding subunit ClpX